MLVRVGRKSEHTIDVQQPPAPPTAAGAQLQRPPRQHYLTHFPKHPGCETCQLSKCQRKRAARVKQAEESADRSRPVTFGDMVTADHVVFSERDSSHDNKRYILTIYDVAVSFEGHGVASIQCVPRSFIVRRYFFLSWLESRSPNTT